MHVGRKAQKREKKAMSVSLYGNLFFVIVEIVMAIYTSSQAVLLDAIYDGVEFCMLLPSLFLIPLLYKPSNEKHPFGYMQIESMFVVVKGITMTGVTVGLILNNIEIMIHGGRKVAFDTIAWFELFAFFLGITVSIYLKYKNRLMDSPMITMEMEGWEIDSIASFGMAIAFFLPVLLPFPWFRPITPYLDQIITVTLSIFMLPTPIKTVITGLRDLFLIPPEEETVDEIKETIEPVLNAMVTKSSTMTFSVPEESSGSVFTSPLTKIWFPLPGLRSYRISVSRLLRKNIRIFILNFCRILCLPRMMRH